MRSVQSLLAALGEQMIGSCGALGKVSECQFTLQHTTRFRAKGAQRQLAADIAMSPLGGSLYALSETQGEAGCTDIARLRQGSWLLMWAGACIDSTLRLLHRSDLVVRQGNINSCACTAPAGMEMQLKAVLVCR